MGWAPFLPFAADMVLMKHFAQDVGCPAHKLFSSALLWFCGRRTLRQDGRWRRDCVGVGAEADEMMLCSVRMAIEIEAPFFSFKRGRTPSLN